MSNWNIIAAFRFIKTKMLAEPDNYCGGKVYVRSITRWGKETEDMGGDEVIKIVQCKGCGADIVWLKTTKGKNIPVDADSVTSNDEVFDREVHSCHFDTCSKASMFRKGKK